jgi:hypothetical protein
VRAASPRRLRRDRFASDQFDDEPLCDVVAVKVSAIEIAVEITIIIVVIIVVIGVSGVE